MKPTTQSARAHAAAAILLVALSALMLWPLPRLIARAAADPNATLTTAWLHDAVWHSFDTRVPPPHLVLGILGVPFRAAGASPLLTHNLLLVLGFAFSGYAAFLLTRTVTGSWWAALASGIVFAFVPWRFAQLADTPQVWSGWLPLAAAAAIAFARRRTWVRGVLLVLAIAMCVATYVTGDDGRLAFPGYGAVILAAIGAIGPLGRDARLRRLVLFGAIAAILFGVLVPARGAVAGYAGLALLAGIGAMKLIRHRNVVGLLIAALLVFELRPTPPRFHLIDTDVPPVDRFLAETPGGAILELPVRPGVTDAEYRFRSTTHHRPTVIEPKLAAAFAGRPIDLAVLDHLNVTTLVVHADAIVGHEAVAMRDFLLRAVDAGKLRFVARFDRGIEGDYVFETGRGETKPFFGPQPLTRPVVWLDEPQRDAEVRGSVRVLGWGLAPAGIKRVRVFVDNHEEHVDAQLFPRPDVAALYPWHDASKAGFTVDIPRRKREGRVDIEVEVTDLSGRTVRAPQRWFAWSR
ncbi:MAG TPA: hypothetical protein VEU30_06875 [Thermoanaerobaculia bacterium]|nr:hypothetical protein [Thermoanaerobaculia bacterium]